MALDYRRRQPDSANLSAVTSTARKIGKTFRTLTGTLQGSKLITGRFG